MQRRVTAMMKTIEAFACDLRREYGDVSVFELCENLGILVTEQDLPESVNGFYVNFGSKYVVILKAGMQFEKKRYVCAHELGHVLLHTDLNSVFLREETGFVLDKLEAEADYFAACLLLDGELSCWKLEYGQLTVEQAAALSGLPERVVSLKFGA